MKIKEFVPMYKAFKLKTCKIASVSAYMLIIRNVILPVLGDVELSDVSNSSAEKIKSFCEGKGLCRKTIKDNLICLKNILKVASYLGVAETKNISVLWGTDNDERYQALETYSTDQVKKLVTALEDAPSFVNLAILLTIYSGLRIGEICGLRWEDVDIEHKVIRVNRTIQRIYLENEVSGKMETMVIISPPKTKSSQREIPISPKIFKIMKNFSKICRPDYYVASGTSSPIEPRTFRNYYKNQLNKIGLPYIKFHGLRHTFASQLISSKADVKTVSTILGHSDISTTLNTYVHPSQDDKRNAISKLRF